MPPSTNRVWEIFLPYAAQRTTELVQKNLRFAYYTTAETAWKIIRNREIWMRDARTLNDYKEIEYGASLLREFYNGSAGNDFKNVLNSIFSGLSSDLEQKLNEWLPQILSNSFMTCFSEHPSTE